MPTLDAITFDTAGWNPVARDRRAAWRNEFADDLVVLLNYGPPPVPAVGDPRGSLQTGLAGAGGAVQVMAAERRAVAGVPAVACLLRVVQHPSGFTYTAGVILPFARFTFTILFTAGETRLTGVREALGFAAAHLAGDCSTSPPPSRRRFSTPPSPPTRRHGCERTSTSSLLQSCWPRPWPMQSRGRRPACLRRTDRSNSAALLSCGG